MTKKPAANASAVDRIVYLESLVSNTQAIDAMVDDLRLVTSRADASLRINPEDEAILKNVEKRLKEYLIHEDPLRSFTAESLAARLQQHFASKPLLTPRRILWGMIGGSVLFASIGGLLAKSDIEGFAPRFGTSILYTGIHLGAAWFFMKSMQFFNSKVRDAYSLIAAGVIALGLGQLVQPLLSLAGLDSSPYLPIIIIAITLPAIVPLYLGGRRLALILEIKNWATSLKVMVLLWALSTAIIMLIPRPDPGVPVWLYNFSVVMQSWMVAMSAASAFILYKITGISAKYSKVNKSLLHALAALTAFTVFMFIANNISVKFGTLQIIGVSIGATAVGILLLRAGYVFYTRERA